MALRAPIADKQALWAIWVVSTLVTTVECILMLLTFANVSQMKAFAPSSQLTALLASTLLAPIFSILLCIIAFFILLWQTWAWHRRRTGFAYAFITATYLNLSFFMLLTGIILISNHHWIDDFSTSPMWTKGDTSAYDGAIVMAFVTVIVYLLCFVGLVMLERSSLERSRALEDLSAPIRGDVPLSNIASPSVISSSTTATEAPDTPSDYRESVAASNRARGAWVLP